jgi:ParB family chromosome partitioning protein
MVNANIIVGERRCEAARQAGLDKIPGIYIDTRNYEEVSLVENMIRTDLTFVEEAEAIKRLMESHQYTQENVAVILSKSRVNITETLLLTKLPQIVRDE